MTPEGFAPSSSPLEEERSSAELRGQILPAGVAPATSALGEPRSSAELREQMPQGRLARSSPAYETGASLSTLLGLGGEERTGSSVLMLPWRLVPGDRPRGCLDAFASSSVFSSTRIFDLSRETHSPSRDWAALQRITEDSHLSRFPGPPGFQPGLPLREFMIQGRQSQRRLRGVERRPAKSASSPRGGRPTGFYATTASFLRKGIHASRSGVP